VSDYFELDRESPYTLLVAPVKSKWRIEGVENGAVGLDKLKAVHSTIPAVTHVDYSARIQTIAKQDHSRFYDVVNAFYKKTGCPVFINTSFNVRGEPIVCSPEHAFTCFMRTNMDYLIMGNYLLDKKEQPAVEHDVDWQKEFELD